MNTRVLTPSFYIDIQNENENAIEIKGASDI